MTRKPTGNYSLSVVAASLAVLAPKECPSISSGIRDIAEYASAQENA